MASGDAVNQIKERLNILDVVSSYVELHRAGKHFKGRCPFHGEKTPSFHVSPDRGTYHCFGCGVGGDIFSFVEAIDGVDFKEALKTLAQKAGVELVPEKPEKRTEREKLAAIMEAATAFYEAELQQNAEALAYLENRGVTKETIAKWRIGFAPGPPKRGWREVKNHLNAVGFSDALIIKTGLIKTADAGKEAFDTFRDRIMFPLRDNAGRIVAYSGRILHPDDKAPKYVNSPETELYHKSELLYGYDFAKHHLRQLPFWLLVEGQFDVVMSHQAGYKTAVAVSGTALTLHHVQLLERMSKNVVLALDTDKAGINAMKKAADIMLRRGMDVKVARFTDGADPADMVIADLPGFKQAIANSVHVIEFLLDHLRREITDDRTYKLRVREEVVPFVPLIPNHIDQEHFEGVIATALSTTKDAIHFEVQRIMTKATIATTVNENQKPPVTRTPRQPVERVDKHLAYLLAVIQILPDTIVARALENEITQISGQNLLALKATLPTFLISELSFTLETQFDGLTAKVRNEEILHQLNIFRTTYYKQTIQTVRAHMSREGIDNEKAMETLGHVSGLLQQPAYTESIFTEPSS